MGELSDGPLSSRPRVAAVVLNSVSHDTRVLKEAASLQAAGYDVTIFGLQDNRTNEPETYRSDGVHILRCAWRGQTYRLLARLILLIGLGGAGVVAMFIVLASGWLYPLAMEFLQSSVAPVVLFNVVCAIVLMVAALVVVWRPFRRMKQTAERYSAMENHRLPHAKGVQQSVLQRWLLTPMSRRFGNRVQNRMILQAMEAFRPDVVHCHDLNALPIGCRYVRKHGVRLVYDSHEIFEEISSMKPLKRRWVEFQQRRCSRFVDLFITINDSIAKYLNEKYPKLPPAVIVKNAAKRPEDTVEYDGRLHDAAGLDETCRILLYQGGFSKHRGLTVLLHAAPLLPEGWALVMMGWGPLESELRALAARLDPQGSRIRFVPGAPLAELPQWTSGGTLGVIPYENVCLNHWFCTPNKLWEYPIARVPILASPFPELRRVIETYDVGVLMSDPITPQSIASAVASVDDAALSRMRKNCERFMEDDDWSRYAQQLVAAYARLLGSSTADASPVRPVISTSSTLDGARTVKA